jgi:UDP-N-acetyl-alpha-D-quinovosamine dehydrogenase
VKGAWITGASGFVGRALAAALPGNRALSLGNPDWESHVAAAPLEDAVVFHLAARVHGAGSPDERDFEHDNVAKSRRLAREAVRRGARRLVFLSTVKVYGDESPQRPLRHDDSPAPVDAYGRSKLAAERALAEAAAGSALQLVIVRSPLVLGGGAKGNLERLMALADSPWPLPFASIANRRSFVHLADLVRLLALCGESVQAPGRIFIAAHAAGVSTPRLVGGLRRALGRRERLFRCSPRLLETTAAIVGQGEVVRRLTRSLECDPSETERALGWSARIGLEEAAGDLAHAWRTGWR